MLSQWNVVRASYDGSRRRKAFHTSNNSHGRNEEKNLWQVHMPSKLQEIDKKFFFSCFVLFVMNEMIIHFIRMIKIKLSPVLCYASRTSYKIVIFCWHYNLFNRHRSFLFLYCWAWAVCL